MRRPSPLLPAAVGAAAALLALSTLGLTWVERSVTGPLGRAGSDQLEQLSGRDVAPLVAALVPGVTAVVVVGLLLRGRWRVVPLLLAAVGAGAAGLSAAALAVGGDAQGGTTTVAPVVAAVACLVAACSAVGAALLAWRPVPRTEVTHPERTRSGEPHPEVPSAGAAPPDGSRHEVAEPDEQQAVVPVTGPAGADAPSAEEPGDLWRALDEGRDPTQAP